MKNILKIVVAFCVIFAVLVRLKDCVVENTVKDISSPHLEYIESKKFTFRSNEDLNKWDEKRLSSKRTKYRISDEGVQGYLEADSEDSASALFLKESIQIKKWPYVSWEWDVKKFPDRDNPEDVENKEEFDFAAQFYVIFKAKFFLSAQAIQYVWLKGFPKGTVLTNPYTDNVKIMVLRSGGSTGWQLERRNVVEDYKLLFGEMPEKNIAAISLMSDSDSTGTSAKAFFRNISFGYINEKESGESLSVGEDERADTSYFSGILTCAKSDLLRLRGIVKEISKNILEKIRGKDEES